MTGPAGKGDGMWNNNTLPTVTAMLRTFGMISP
jgi:hypothetical protein